MANIWLRGDGNDGNAGTQKEAPKLTLQAALTAAGAGGRVYVSALHAESGAATTITSPGTLTNPTLVLTVPDWGAATGTGAPASLTTGASFASSGAVAFSGAAYVYGMVVTSSANSSVALRFISGAWMMFEQCELSLTGGSSANILAGSGGVQCAVILHNTSLRFANVAHKIRAASRFRWTGSASSVLGTVPTILFLCPTNSDSPTINVEGVDLSALGSGKSLVDVSGGGIYNFVDCKLGSSVAITSGTHAGLPGTIVNLINCDSADTQYRFARSSYEAAETSETTIVRTGGASNGTTVVSRKIVTTAGAGVLWPYTSLPIEFWNETIGSPITLTIPVLTDGVTLTDAEAWLEVEYLGTSGFPLGLFAYDRVSDPIFGTPASQTTDNTSSWTTTGLSSPVKQSLSVTFTPQEKGLIRARVMVAKATTTVYYDPRVLSESGRQYQSVAGFVNEGPSGMPLSRVFGGL